MIYIFCHDVRNASADGIIEKKIYQGAENFYKIAAPMFSINFSHRRTCLSTEIFTSLRCKNYDRQLKQLNPPSVTFLAHVEIAAKRPSDQIFPFVAPF
jgi:hypothetical protein